MKTFRQILEQTRPPIDSGNYLYQFVGKSVCDILSSRIPPRKATSILMDYQDTKDLSFPKLDQGVKPEVTQFYDSLRTWIGGMKNFDRDIHEKLSGELVQYFQNCPSRSGWSRYTGKVYRGLKVPITASSLKVDVNNTVKIYDPAFGSMNTFAVGTYTYQSKLPAQSWSKDKTTAVSFAKMTTNNSKDISLILEYPITAKDSISLKYLGNPQELEVIRIGNSPINIRCYVWIGSDNRITNAALKNTVVQAMVARGILAKMPD